LQITYLEDICNECEGDGIEFSAHIQAESDYIIERKENSALLCV